MTSTSFNVGLTDNTRLSSRVLRPPGGGHTDIFGGETEPPQPTSRRGASATSGMASIVGHDEPKPVNNIIPPASNQNGQTTPQEPTLAPIPGPEPKETIAKPEPAAVQPVAVQPAAVQPAAVQPAAVPQAKVDPPKRVRVPPGGFSSGLW